MNKWNETTPSEATKTKGSGFCTLLVAVWSVRNCFCKNCFYKNSIPPKFFLHEKVTCSTSHLRQSDPLLDWWRSLFSLLRGSASLYSWWQWHLSYKNRFFSESHPPQLVMIIFLHPWRVKSPIPWVAIHFFVLRESALTDDHHTSSSSASQVLILWGTWLAWLVLVYTSKHIASLNINLLFIFKMHA